MTAGGRARSSIDVVRTCIIYIAAAKVQVVRQRTHGCFGVRLACLLSLEATAASGVFAMPVVAGPRERVLCAWASRAIRGLGLHADVVRDFSLAGVSLAGRGLTETETRIKVLKKGRYTKYHPFAQVRLGRTFRHAV